MAKFVLFFTYTPETWQKLTANPSDRRAAADAIVGSVGGSVETMYFMFGAWDGLVVFSAPDSASAASLSVAVIGSGAFGKVETHELIETGALGDVLAKAKAASAGYRPPGT